MKTPREFLLGRHETAGPRLDQIRHTVLHAMGEPRRSISRKLWEELILPVRRAWIGMAAGWVIVIALNLLTGADTQPGVNTSGPLNPNSVLALQRQEHLVARLIEEDNEPSSPAKPPEQQPRSEAPVEQKIV
jgi:hypothetical protein